METKYNGEDIILQSLFIMMTSHIVEGFVVICVYARDGGTTWLLYEDFRLDFNKFNNLNNRISYITAKYREVLKDEYIE